MFNNITQTIITHNDDGTTSVKHVGQQVFPLEDTQGTTTTMLGASYEPTATDSGVIAGLVSAVQASAQSIATRDNVRVRLNGSATEYVKPS